MTTQETISRLEALLSRIRTRASEARPVVALASAPEPELERVPIPTAPPPAEAAAVLASTRGASPEVAPELESRARLVAEREPELLELDDRHVVADSTDADADVSIVEVSVVEVSVGEVSVVEVSVVEEIIVGEEEVLEATPPSSRRPIAEPLDAAPPEPTPTHTPPPESGKQVAALSFDDDFTGVRDAAQRPAPPPDPHAPEIHLASQHPPAIALKHEMEAELDAPHTTQPASDRLPPERPPVDLQMQAEVIRPVLAQAPVADVHGAVTFAPQSFGELLDATLAL